MGVFDNCSVLLELKNLPFKEKKKLKSIVTLNGGSISFIVNKQCSLVVTSDLSNLSSNRLHSIQKNQTPVVGLDYLHKSVERGVLLSVDEYKMDTSSSPDPPPPWKRPLLSLQKVPPPQRDQLLKKTIRSLGGIYKESDSALPTFPDDFQVAKYSVFGQCQMKFKFDTCALLVHSYQKFVLMILILYHTVRAHKAAVMDQLVFLSTSEEAVDVYKELSEELERSELQRMSGLPAEAPHLGSAPLEQLLLEEKLNSGELSPDVAAFVELLWTEALGCLENILRVPISGLSLNDVSRAEGLLLQAQRKLKEGNEDEASSLLDEVFTLLPHREPRPQSPTARFLSQKLDLCQLIRDVLNVGEMTMNNPKPSSVGKYRALRCHIEAIPRSSSVFQNVAALLADRSVIKSVQIQQIMCVSRAVELETFQSEIGNVKPLLHSSSPSNFVGIMSRGLLLPHVGVEHHGITRTDVGNLGSGIYFGDAVSVLSTSLKYAKPSETDGSRFLLVCDVALGVCKNLYKRDLTLTEAPQGYHSVHGVRQTNKTTSEFEDDEYVVYSLDQVKMKYIVQFRVEGDEQKDFSPDINLTAEPIEAAKNPEHVEEDLENVKNPLEDVKAGLLDSSGQQLPLQAVHVKCKLMDLLSQVIIFQKYTNQSSVPIEAKYVFPLDDSAAVCGFEAFINGKHVVGEVKEKAAARKEYKQAIAKGHGAYLMDQGAPDVFTISVGNLPPGATVLIKVTFVSELVVRDGSILFSLPGSVAPWQESAALNQTTQVSVEKVCVASEAARVFREFTLDISVEMPFQISSLTCITHQVKIKRMDCKAVVSVLPGQVMGSDGFQMSVTLSEVHLPRMWVEKHPDKDSQACMLVFYPNFEFDSSSEGSEVVLLLDTSESMKGESLQLAQKIALQVLKNLKNDVKINIVLFGTVFRSHRSFPVGSETRRGSSLTEIFSLNMGSCSSVGGSTELWRPLRALSLLPPSAGVRNLLLLSDGHIQNAAATLQLLRDNAQHSRLFTCGFSSTANRHMLRAMAQAGGGAYEFFDSKAKHTWAEKVERQVKRMSSPGCSSVSVKWQQFNPRAPPVQAPKQLNSLFNDCHTLVYGFVPHCTQATLLGDLRGQELQTMVSTTELQKTRGTFLHKLTARALIRDYEDGNLDITEAEHEGKKAELKSFIIDLSKEFSILSQFTSFVAIEERDSGKPDDGVTDIPKLIAEEDVDFLPYITWTLPEDKMNCGNHDSFPLSSTEEGAPIPEVSTALENMKSPTLDPYFSAPFRAHAANQHSPVTFSQGTDMEYDDFYSLYHEKHKRVSGYSYWSPLSDRRSKTSSNAGISQGLFGQPLPLSGSPSKGSILRRVVYSAVQQEATRDSAGEAPLRHFASECFLNQEEELSAFQENAGRTVLSEVPESDPTPPRSFTALQAQAPQLKSRTALRKKSIKLDQRVAPPPALQAFSEASLPPLQVASGAPPPPPPGASGAPRRPPRAFGAFRRPMRIEAPSPPGAINKNVCSTPKEHAVSFFLDVFVSFPSAVLGAAPPQTKSRIVVAMRCRCAVQSTTIRLWSHLSKQCCYRGLCYFKEYKFPQISHGHRDNLLSFCWFYFFCVLQDGYWELTVELGKLINVNVDVFANVFLKNKGIHSLGAKVNAGIQRLVATLLVLQLMREEKLEEGKLLQSLFHLMEPTGSRSECWQQVKKAVDWVRWADREYPCACSRLELGWSWESSTRQLLGFERFPPFSPLISLELQKAAAPLAVH
uniref:Poly [ADP-ribose] polymerase n=1 Tax=Poecilia formosa TaxID=48698 RepID=A0A087X8Z0_POEFO